MASAAEAAATQQQYLAQVALTATMTTALGNVTQAAPDPASSAYQAAIHAVMEQLAQVSASIARDYYQQVRRDAGISSPIRVEPVPPPPASLINASIDYGLRADNSGTPADFQAAVQKRIEAANQKILADIAREQVATAVAGDELAIGFRRVPRPDACAFCILMAIRTSTRGESDAEHFGVYKSRASASGTSFERDFIGEGTAKFHNNCHCVVEPVFSPVEQLPAWLEDARQLYSTGDGLNGFRRALYAQRIGKDGPSSPIAPAAPATPAPAHPQVAALLAQIDASMRRTAA